ncbi:MAG: hypothetical protein N2578_06800 [Bdellovibrionaceae bacterium]|nr:hypothetical protein [Pseudobdellovibrionaceae bacterium]
MGDDSSSGEKLLKTIRRELEIFFRENELKGNSSKKAELNPLTKEQVRAIGQELQYQGLGRDLKKEA